MTESGQILYIDGACGISGDMVAASLLDLGGDRARLENALRSLKLENVDFEITAGSSHGVAGIDFNVKIHDPPHHHHHHPSGHEEDRRHEHRNLKDVFAVLEAGELSASALALAKRIFTITARAEAKAHGCGVDEVHFHEVGAVDSIIDVAAAAVLLDELSPAEVIVTGFSEGRGVVVCQHGALPIPVPAVLNTAADCQIPLHICGDSGEMVTPTGIAIAAAARTGSELPERFVVKKVGIGLGKRDFGRPNILRTMLITPAEGVADKAVTVLECDLDDATGEELGFALERILEAGALDVCYLPCFMKKNRPGWLLKCVVPNARLAAVETAVFAHTTTLGVRKLAVERTTLERAAEQVQLPYGEVAVKTARKNGVRFVHPEYESAKALALATGKSLREVCNDAIRAAAAPDAP